MPMNLSLKIAEWFRYGNWTGQAYSAGKGSDPFVALTDDDRRVPGVDDFGSPDEFDRALSKPHDIRYDDAQQEFLTNFGNPNIAHKDAVIAYLQALRAADQRFIDDAPLYQANSLRGEGIKLFAAWRVFPTTIQAYDNLIYKLNHDSDYVQSWEGLTVQAASERIQMDRIFSDAGINNIEAAMKVFLGFPAVGDGDLAAANDQLREFMLSLGSQYAKWIISIIALFDTSIYSTPLVLDLDGDGVELTSLAGDGAAPVYWDIDNDGFGEATAWVKPDDGLLARDLNSNGTIDSHSELFGTETTDGFAVLATLDSNNDGAITAADSDWGALKIWRDLNQDGESQPDELFSLSDLNITSIDLNANGANYEIAGNPIAFESTYTIDGVGDRAIVDALFAYDNVNSIYKGAYTLDSNAMLLPHLRGYGRLPDLFVAMSLKPALLSLVEDVAALDMASDPAAASLLVRQIMHSWAGVEDVDPESVGPWHRVDARDIRFVEKFLDVVIPIPPNTGYIDAVRSLQVENVFSEILSAVKARLFWQTSGEQFFETRPDYDPITDSFSGNFSFDFDAIQAAMSGKSMAEIVGLWSNILSMAVEPYGASYLDATMRAALDTAINDSDPNHLLTLEALLIEIPGLTTTVGAQGLETFVDTAANDAWYNNITTETDQVLVGLDGDDYLVSAWGNDILYGGAGNDTLVIGNQICSYKRLYGGDGNDRIVGRAIAGQAIMDGGAGNDELVTTGSIGNYIVRNFEKLTCNGSGIGLTADQLNSFSTIASTTSIAELYAESAGTYNLNGKVVAQYIVMHGSSGNDIFIGDVRDDDLRGNAGNDTLRGGSGNDTLDGGLGNDKAAFTGNATDYDISINQYGTITVTDTVSGRDGTDTLQGIEFLQFADRSLAPSDIGAPPLPDGLYHVGSEILVNTSTSSDQNNPAITGLANGNFIVAWQDRSGTLGDSQGTSIKAQLFNAAGGKLGEELLVNSVTVGYQMTPSITALASGGFVATWESNGIMAQLFDAIGGKVGNELHINSTGWTQVKPEVTGLADGNFVVTWQDGYYDGDAYLYGTTPAFSIQAQIYSASGTAIGSQFQVNATTTNDQESPDITALNNGGFVVTWQNDYDWDSKAQIFDATGTKVGTEFLLSNDTSSMQVIPSVTSLANGGFVATWIGNDRIEAQMFDAAGTKVGDEIEVSVPTGYSQYFLNPTIALANGGFAVTWTDPDGTQGDASGTAILAQAFGADGEKIGTEFLVNTQTSGYQINPSITALADGGFAISWQDGDQFGGIPGSGTLGDSNGSSIKVQVFGMNVENTVEGTAGTDTLIGSAVATLVGNGGEDTFIFRSGRADGDTIADFAGNGASAGDVLRFQGFGTSGSTFTQVGSTTQWKIHSGLDGHDEFITLANNAAVHTSDFLFV